MILNKKHNLQELLKHLNTLPPQARIMQNNALNQIVPTFLLNILGPFHAIRQNGQILQFPLKALRLPIRFEDLILIEEGGSIVVELDGTVVEFWNVEVVGQEDAQGTVRGVGLGGLAQGD